MMAAYDSWGSSWGTPGAGAWGASWYHTATVTAVDTHDGFDDDDSAARKKRELRQMLEYALDPDSALLPVLEEVLTVAEPALGTVRLGVPTIDWERVERDAFMRAKLMALQAEYARQMRELEDEEDVSIILLH